MQFLTSVIEGISGFVEFEGRVLRASAIATARAIAWIAVAAAMAVAGLGFLLYGVFLEGSRLAGPAIGACIAGAAALLVAAAISLSGRAAPRR